MNYDIIMYFWIFVIGSFIGFLMESVWCFIKYKKYESRKGLIYGYFIPIYGIATMILSLFIHILNINNLFICYVLTFLIAFVVEYLSSLFQEKLFKTKSWDYSDMKYNLNGRVNLFYLIIWSFFGVFWYLIEPIIINFIFNSLNGFKILDEVTNIFSIYMLYDIIISVVACLRQRMRRTGINARNKIEEWLDNKYTDEYMKKVYANASFIDM